VRQRLLVVGWVAGVLGGLVACGGASSGDGNAATPAGDGAPSEIARIHKRRCGSCHVRVEPGERTREQLEAALSRHRKRVHLSEEQWGQMVDYLAVK
jgi:hypothetical protein